jgi:predicted transcriptional regulator
MSIPTPPENPFTHLPPLQALVMQLLWQPREMGYAALCTTLLAQNLVQGQIDVTLYELVKQGYLATSMESGELAYVVQVNHQLRPSKRDEQKLWSQLDVGFEINVEQLKRDSTPRKSSPGLYRFDLGDLAPSAEPTAAKPTPKPKPAGKGGIFNAADLLSLLDKADKEEKSGE